MTLRKALLLLAPFMLAALVAGGCVRIRPAPSAAATATPDAPAAPAAMPPAAELSLALSDLVPVTASPTPAPRRYTVEPGDTLWIIAERFGVSAEDIVKASKLSSPNSLAVGDTLVIPGRPAEGDSQPVSRPAATPTPAQRRYTVEAGDTLATIAERFGVSTADIVRASKLANPDRLAIGDTLVIPGVGPATAPQPARSASAPEPARRATSTPTATPAPQRRYTVQEGDSLWSIAERYGISVNALQAANGGVTPERLRVGQTLVIPAAR